MKMSDDIPLELQEEIIKRFPVESLIRFRSVSKAWKSLIDSPKFIAAHSVLHAHNSHRLLVSYYDLAETEKKYVSIVTDERNFAPIVPLSDNLLKDSNVVGSSHGLFCLSSYRKNKVVLWNPSIRKSVAISLPNVSYGIFDTFFGFGVCPVTNDPKILMVSRWPYGNPNNVRVFSLSSGDWRIPTINLPYQLIYFPYGSQVVIDRFMYWLIADRYGIDGGGFCSENLILSFDLTNDEFGEIHLPHNLAQNSAVITSFLKIRESLALIELNNQSFDVWMMEDGAVKSFMKVFTVEMPFADLLINSVLGFWEKDEVLIVELQKVSDLLSAELVVFEPFTNHIDYPLISGSRFSFSVFSYTETLLLLNRPEFSVYLDMGEDGDDD